MPTALGSHLVIPLVCRLWPHKTRVQTVEGHEALRQKCFAFATQKAPLALRRINKQGGALRALFIGGIIFFKTRGFSKRIVI